VTNRDAARAVFSVASLLESQGANPWRVRAYRRAAIKLLQLPEPLVKYTNEDGQLALPWLGESLRKRLGELAICGRLGIQLEILAALPASQRELLGVPGVGPKTAYRLERELRIRSVRGLVRAARHQKLRTLRGFGPTRERQLLDAAQALLTGAAAAA
jgi:DNA polymerase (family 10)